MNDRIKNLARQAGLEWHLSPPHFTNTSNPIDFPVNPNFKLEEFAALIIQECDQFVAERFDNSEPRMRPGELQKHFGVTR